MSISYKLSDAVLWLVKTIGYKLGQWGSNISVLVDSKQETVAACGL